ncbi:hypothetical protein [Halobacterium wangiae]|uniref:hypothetical protein n=1 Tax=Halobacterium wangiae TaxID=2902623 RepID=UPI001E477E80|nr:hypothetical protein [Halobacterium wangiae]
MTPPTDSADSSLAPITDAESLRDRSDVPFHDDADDVPAETVDAVAGLDDLAVVGVTDDDGSVLLRRLTPDCELKLPVESVGDDEDFVAAARVAVEDVVGLPVELDAVEGVWTFEAREADGDRSATRRFVVFGATPAVDTAGVSLPTDDSPGTDAPAEAGWFDEFPEDGERAPGTDLFFD